MALEGKVAAALGLLLALALYLVAQVVVTYYLLSSTRAPIWIWVLFWSSTVIGWFVTGVKGLAEGLRES